MNSFRVFTIGSNSVSSLKYNSIFVSSGSLVASPLLSVLLMALSVLVSASCTFFSMFR